MQCKTSSPVLSSTACGQLSQKSTRQMPALSNIKATSDLSLWKNRTGRYAIIDVNERFYYEDNGTIYTTPEGSQAQTFADFDAACRAAKQLNRVGYKATQVVFLIC
jgi:hypothetical protein